MRIFGRPFRPRLWPTVIAAAAVLVLLGLGVWQLERLAWKQGLIDDLQARWAAEPIPLPQDLSDIEGLEYRRVLLSGRFLHDRELVLPGKTYKGTYGRWIATPFVLDDGRGVIVNRGWVPEDYADPKTRETGLPEGAVTIEGILRRPGWQGWESMRPDNAPDRNRWYYFDLPAMTEVTGLDRPVEAFYVEAVGEEASGLLPIGLELAVDLPNDHLEYALTWFALAIALAVIYLISQTRRPPSGPSSGGSGPAGGGRRDSDTGRTAAGDGPREGPPPDPSARDGPRSGGRPRLLVAEPFCHDWTGHGATMARQMREAALALGFDPLLAVHARCDPDLARSLDAKPLFTLPTDDDPAPDWQARRQGARRLAEQLRAFSEAARSGDLILLSTAQGVLVPALADWLCGESGEALEDGGRLSPGVRLVVFLLDAREYYLPDDQGQRPYMRDVIRRLTALPSDRRPHLAAFTSEHADALERIFGWPVTCLPLPFAPPGELSPKPSAEGVPRVLLTPGNLREEKGAALLPAIARLLAQDLAGWRWRIGGEEKEAPGALDESLARHPLVERLPSRLSEEGLAAQIVAADLVLLPYDPARYRDRSSGFLCEAACMGRPLVVPADSSPGERLIEGDAVGVGFETWDAAAVSKAVAAAAAALPRLQREAMALAPALRRRHDPVAVLRAARAIAEGDVPPLIRPAIKRLVIVEAGLLDRSGHYAGIVGMLVRGARSLGLSTRVLLNAVADSEVVAELGGEAILDLPRQHTDDQAEIAAFAEALAALAESLRPDDLLLFPTLMRPELLAVSAWLSRHGPPACRIVLLHHMLLPSMQALRAGEPRPRVVEAFARFHALPPGDRPLIYAFTPELAAETEAIVNYPFAPIDLPRKPEPPAVAPPALDKGGSGVLATPGAQRPSKGLLLYDALAEALAARLPGWRWTINAAASRRDQPGDRALIDGLARHGCIDLLPGPLSDEAQRAQLAEAQVLLLPYEAEAYRNMFSSTFAEGVAAGRPLVVPAGTWMARELEAGRAAGVSFDEHTVTSILDALERLLSDLPRHASEAMAIAGRIPRARDDDARFCLRRILADARTPW